MNSLDWKEINFIENFKDDQKVYLKITSFCFYLVIIYYVSKFFSYSWKFYYSTFERNWKISLCTLTVMRFLRRLYKNRCNQRSECQICKNETLHIGENSYWLKKGLSFMNVEYTLYINSDISFTLYSFSLKLSQRREKKIHNTSFHRLVLNVNIKNSKI